MDANMGCYPLLSSEIRDYYEKVSKGLIEERPYDYWGPDTAKEKAHWQQWWLPIKKPFYPIDWDAAFTGRGIAKNNKKAIERPGLVGPMGETLMMDMDPLTGADVWSVDSSSPSEAEVGRGVKKQRMSSLKVASKMYKRAWEHFVTIIEVHRTKTNMESTPERGRNHVPNGRNAKHQL